MLSDNTRPKGSPWPFQLQATRPVPDPYALPKTPSSTPRATFQYKTFQVEVWCISDLLEDLPPECQSSSSAKDARLSIPFQAGSAPNLVIAEGTAGSCLESPNRNGWATIGTSVFMHDAHPETFKNAFSTWRGNFDKLIASSLDEKLYSEIAQFDSGSAVSHFLPVPLNPSEAPNISIGYGDVALCTLIVTDYTQYNLSSSLLMLASHIIRILSSLADFRPMHSLTHAPGVKSMNSGASEHHQADYHPNRS